MSHSLQDATVLVVGGGSGIAHALAARVVADGGHVVLGGRDLPMLEAAAAEFGRDARALRIDLSDEASIAAAAAQLPTVDHVVSLASAPAKGPVGELGRDAVVRAFDAKVIGPLLLAGALAPHVSPGGSLLLFSGIVGWKPAPGAAVMATTNAAVAALAAALAVDLAPLRVNALSPGIVDSGAWDGPDRDTLFARTAAANPARRVGTTDDVVDAAVMALTNPYVTGTVLHVDGGGRWV